MTESCLLLVHGGRSRLAVRRRWIEEWAFGTLKRRFQGAHHGTGAPYEGPRYQVAELS
ncbi:MAG: hypothetical protein OXG16_05140 [Rhodospirillales bacterium]|nr:hypothetical protein [Rhodospirillales bacterium]